MPEVVENKVVSKVQCYICDDWFEPELDCINYNFNQCEDCGNMFCDDHGMEHKEMFSNADGDLRCIRCELKRFGWEIVRNKEKGDA